MKTKFMIIGIVIALAITFVSGEKQGVADNSGPIVATIAGKKGVVGKSDGTGTMVHFSISTGITTDGTNLYIADTGNQTIRKVVISTGAVTTLAGTPGIYGSKNGAGTTALFKDPQGIATDGTNLYIADSDNEMIRLVVLATGEVKTLAGTFGVGGSADGTGSAARFLIPYGIAQHGGCLYVTDAWNNTIRKIVIATAEVTTLAGTAGISGSSDGTGTNAKFNHPTGIATDGTNLYVVDNGNSTIRKIVLSTRVVSTLAGSAGVTGSTDGIGSSALFQSPQSIAMDTNYIYVTDTKNYTVRKIVLATGEVSTLAGATGVVGQIDGNALNARFKYPYGIATDGINLYLTDSGTVRMIHLDQPSD